MNTIEQKLKTDAQAFKKNPPQAVYKSIVHQIEHREIAHSKVESFGKYRWLIPSGLAVAVLMLVVININPTTRIDNTMIQPNFNQKFMQISKLNINELSITLESNLINDIQAEKKALQADFQYLKSKFIL